MNLTPAERDLLSNLLQLEANQRGQVFDEVFESLTGHDELDALMEELERRNCLVWEPDQAEIERRLRSMDETPEHDRGSTWEEVLERVSQSLAQARADREASPPQPRAPRLTGRVGDLAGAALALPPAVRGALAQALLATIEPGTEPTEDHDFR